VDGWWWRIGDGPLGAEQGLGRGRPKLRLNPHRTPGGWLPNAFETNPLYTRSLKPVSLSSRFQYMSRVNAYGTSAEIRKLVPLIRICSIFYPELVDHERVQAWKGEAITSDS
jgi:hypothetical protein